MLSVADMHSKVQNKKKQKLPDSVSVLAVSFAALLTNTPVSIPLVIRLLAEGVLLHCYSSCLALHERSSSWLLAVPTC